MTEQTTEDGDLVAVAKKYVALQTESAKLADGVHAAFTEGRLDQHDAEDLKLHRQLRAIEKIALATPALTPDALCAKAEIVKSYIEAHLKIYKEHENGHALTLSLVRDLLTGKTEPRSLSENLG